MIVRSLAALLIVFVVGCASEKALNRGCASSVRVSAVVFDKAVYNAASQAELIEKFRSHDVEPLWSHILTPGGGDISSTRSVKVSSRGCAVMVRLIARLVLESHLKTLESG